MGPDMFDSLVGKTIIAGLIGAALRRLAIQMSSDNQ
jgi:hypothetical protein